MNIDDPNVQLVQVAASALGPLTEELVFVGGCAVGLLITDLAGPRIRATLDVDLVAELTTHVEYHHLSQRLRNSGFREEMGDIPCRWTFGNLKVDVMPTDPNVLGYSNAWFNEAVESAVTVALPNKAVIKLVAAPVFIATKFEAFKNRGNNDWMSSHDIEDIVNVLDGRPELLKEIAACDSSLKSYLESEFDDMLADTSFGGLVAAHLPPDKASQAREEIIIERMRKIAGL